MTDDIDVKVLSTTAMKAVFEELAAVFDRETGYRLSISLGPSLQLERRLGEGEPADIAILAADGANTLVARGKIVAGSLVDIARSSVAVAVRKGTPKPDISTPEAFKQAVLAARAIAVSKPEGGGQSGRHIAQVFANLGIAEAMRAKSLYGSGGPEGLTGLFLLRGEAELAIQQTSELMAVDGIDIVGPLPASLQKVTLFTAGIPTSASEPEGGRALIEFLTAPAAKRVIKSKGLDPAQSAIVSY